MPRLTSDSALRQYHSGSSIINASPVNARRKPNTNIGHNDKSHSNSRAMSRLSKTSSVHPTKEAKCGGSSSDARNARKIPRSKNAGKSATLPWPPPVNSPLFEVWAETIGGFEGVDRAIDREERENRWAQLHPQQQKKIDCNSRASIYMPILELVYYTSTSVVFVFVEVHEFILEAPILPKHT